MIISQKEFHKIKCKDCDSFLEYQNAKDNLRKYKCLSCKKRYSNKTGKELKNRFKNPFKFSNYNIKQFILLIRKGGDNCEWEKFNETSLPGKEELNSNIDMEDIADAGYMHAKRFCRDCEIKKLGIIKVYILKVIHIFLLMFSKASKKCV